MKKWNLALCLAVCGLMMVGCGDDSSDSGDAGSGTGTGGSGTGTGGTGTGTGGTGTGGMATLTCDDTVESVTMCGTEACPEPSAIEKMFCQVNCCTEGMCGQMNTSSQAAGMGLGDCTIPEVDPSGCPGAGPLPGCCQDNGECGISIGGNCNAGFGGGTPQSCDADAGI